MFETVITLIVILFIGIVSFVTLIIIDLIILPTHSLIFLGSYMGLFFMFISIRVTVLLKDIIKQQEEKVK